MYRPTVYRRDRTGSVYGPFLKETVTAPGAPSADRPVNVR